jgi:glycerol-3-phosphate acyltransferase PlsY
MSSLWAVVAGSFCKPTATFDFTGSLSAPFYLFTAAFGAICAAVVLLTGYSSAASLLASLAMIGILWPLAGPARSAYGLASALLIVVMHRENIARLRAGTENKLPLFGRGGG